VEVLVRYVVAGTSRQSLEDNPVDATPVSSESTLPIPTLARAPNGPQGGVPLSSPYGQDQLSSSVDSLITSKASERTGNVSDGLPIASSTSTVRTNSELGYYSDGRFGRHNSQNGANAHQARTNNRISYHPSPVTIRNPPIGSDRAPSPEKQHHTDASLKLKNISGPLNGAPIPAGYKFGSKEAQLSDSAFTDRERKAKSGRFWGFGRNSTFSSIPFLLTSSILAFLFSCFQMLPLEAA
jgi:hypothetical protein